MTTVQISQVVPTKPRPVVEIQLDGMPRELRERDQWVCWDYQWKDGKWTKVPINASTLKKASSTDPATWSSFETASAAFRRDPNLAGIGYVFGADDPYCGIDVDECLDDSGAIVESAVQVIAALNSYCERSPGGRGLKAIIKGKKPENAKCKKTKVFGCKAIEVYDAERFFTLTGARWADTPASIKDRQAELNQLCEKLWPPPALRLSGGNSAFDVLDDQELIRRASEASNGDKFRRLFAGDTSLHGGDDSVADLAFCCMLAFWTNRNAVQMDRIFRQSVLYRAKWDREDYRTNTINTAIKSCQETYQPRTTDPNRPALRLTGAAQAKRILIDADEHRVIDEAIQALTTDAGVYQRGGLLVRLQRSEASSIGVKRSAGAPMICKIPGANLRDRLTRVADLYKINKKSDDLPAHPPQWLVAGIEARGLWNGIRPLMGINEAPFLRPDGSIVQKPGYDAMTGVLYEPTETFPSVPANPTEEDARVALELLSDVVADFPFEKREHESAWLSSLLTPLARYAFEGPSPLFLVDANIRGAGKGLLLHTNGIIVHGRPMPVSSYSHDACEMRKLITTIAMAGDPIVLLDNLEGPFGNAALDRALTTTRWKDRVLGGNTQVDLPMMTTWFATGNNVIVCADTLRRTVHIRLDVMVENPEHRTDFRHPDLLNYVHANRPRLLIAALTILAAYIRAGRPRAALPPYGSFEGWSDLVRQAVVWLGLVDPCESRKSLAASVDSTVVMLEQLFDAWRQYDVGGDGLVIARLVQALYGSQAVQSDAANAMRAAIESMVGAAPGRNPTARQVGNKLRSVRRRVFGGFYIDLDPSQRRNGGLWRLMKAKEGTNA